ncbi:adenosylmethionine-8-amino-7-oxononanoate aminotransferase [Desulfosporosinus orientis DSM 765]|uniref:Adenosylmethionine-8-amino-7-oxononanoate aminotransferase n=1 Tax=Desulfosporosinus orientis (strain ATCC 19365 / DSM 765 / NCIMB 8382 / VKM B-1628 / Singapore I) TaxID=768706 RepID=G7WAN4_DESOD|nr:aspartate aminotransferase family protein [Desulfosporosinus orientis]AET66802.1 adenosylmethionine-8-amino-7-oxononanoate aminotransferase [Desulfosporosinus orientis DSM 765]
MASYTDTQIEAMKKDDLRYFLHPTSSIVDMESWGGPKIIEEGCGIRLKSIEGKTIIDCGAGLWLNNVGLGRTELAEAAKQQMEKLSYFQTFNGYSHPLVIETAKKVAGMIPMDNPRIFFTSGGSESNDTAYKLARMYWYLQGKPNKHHIIARTKAYHGVSYGAVSATSLPGFWDGFRPLVPAFHHIEHPHCYFCPWGKEQDQCNLECAEALEEKIIELGKENVAAFTAEPIIGTGGAIVPPDGYYQRIHEICDKYDVLFIADEVITGFGRTGKMFGMLHYGVQADIMMMAKGITSGYIPMGAVGISERVFTPIKSHGIFMHGYTYSGHPVACAVALKNIEIVERENLAENARVVGEQLRSRIRDLSLPCIGEVRGIGLINGVQLVQDDAARIKFGPEIGFAKRVSAIAWENGLALRPLMDDGLQLSPALVITETDVIELVDKLGRSIKQAYDEFLGNQP